MAPDVRVREATDGDVAAIRQVARRSWAAAYDDLFDRGTIDEMIELGYAPELLEAMSADETTDLLVAEDDGEVVGYAAATVDDEGSVSDVSVYVDPDDWDRGVGSRLLDEVTDRLSDRGVALVRDYVLVGNDVGNSFYGDRFERIDQREVEIAGSAYTANVYEAEL